MKNMPALLAIAALLTACGGGGGGSAEPAAPVAAAPAPAPTAGPAPAPATLTVTNGYGPATAPANSSVEVWASVLPQSEIVTQWRGAGFTEGDDEWHATAMVPAGGASVTAERQSLDVSFELMTYSAPTAVAKTARIHIPPAPRGVILMLHGTGGDSSLIERAEVRYLALKAISKGYAVVSPEAEEARAGDLDGDGKANWSLQPRASNIDLQALDALLASLYASGRLPPALPQYAVGMSNGGALAVSLGAIAASASGAAVAFPRLRFKAVIAYCAQGRADAAALTTTPTAWYLCGNEDNPAVDNAAAVAQSAAAAARGIATVALAHPATPLYDERFTRVAGVGLAASRAMAAEFRTAGWLDAQSFFTVSSGDIATQVAATPARHPTLAALTRSQQGAVISQIGVMRAEHEFFSDWSARSLRWFARFP